MPHFHPAIPESDAHVNPPVPRPPSLGVPVRMRITSYRVTTPFGWVENNDQQERVGRRLVYRVRSENTSEASIFYYSTYLYI